MRRENYYRPENNSRGNYQQPNREPTYTNYNNYGAGQQPYYPPRRHHHVFIWIVVIILCLGLGWFAADHFLGGDQSSQPQTTVNRYNTTNNKTVKQPQKPQNNPQQGQVAKLQNEMVRLNVSEKDQATAAQFFAKQNAKNQQKIIKMISIINRVIPSDALKKRTLNWILHGN